MRVVCVYGYIDWTGTEKRDRNFFITYPYSSGTVRVTDILVGEGKVAS